jgi:hypothetical protein
VGGVHNLYVFVGQTTGLINVVQYEVSAWGVVGKTNVVDNVYHHIVVSSNGTAWSIILDGVAETLTITAGSNSGNWFADTTGRDNITIGCLTTTSNVNFAIASIGAVRIYSREMLAPEALTNFRQGRNASASNATSLVFNLPMIEGTSNPVDTIGSLIMTATGATWRSQ